MQQLTSTEAPSPHSHSHHSHRSSSAIDAMSDPLNRETRSSADVSNIDSDYYFDDQDAVDPGVIGGE